MSNLLEYYYFKIYNSDKNLYFSTESKRVLQTLKPNISPEIVLNAPLYITNENECARIIQTSDPKNYINSISTEIVLCEIEEKFLNTRNIKNKLLEKQRYFDELQSYFRDLYDYIKQELKQ
jgi:hypothetical protein